MPLKKNNQGEHLTGRKFCICTHDVNDMLLRAIILICIQRGNSFKLGRDSSTELSLRAELVVFTAQTGAM